MVSATDLVVLADSRYTVQAAEQCAEARIERVYNDFFERWPALLEQVGGPKRVAVEAGFVSHLMWQRMAAAAPGVELVPVDLSDLVRRTAALERRVAVSVRPGPDLF